MLFLAFWISKSDSSIKCSDAVLCSTLKIGRSIQSFWSSSISTIPAEFTSKNRPSLLNQQSPLNQAAHSKSNLSYIFQYDPLHSTQNPDSGGGPLSDVFRFSSPSVTPSAAARVRLLAGLIGFDTSQLWAGRLSNTVIPAGILIAPLHRHPDPVDYSAAYLGIWGC